MLSSYWRTRRVAWFAPHRSGKNVIFGAES